MTVVTQAEEMIGVSQFVSLFKVVEQESCEFCFSHNTTVQLLKPQVKTN